MPDINILVYAHREELVQHDRYAKFMMALAEGSESFLLSELVASGFLRIVTNPKIFSPASTIEQGMAFLKEILEVPHCRPSRPGGMHWEIFRGLCVKYKLRGKLIADAYHAAVAIEHGSEWISADGDFGIFSKELRFRHF